MDRDPSLVASFVIVTRDRSDYIFDCLRSIEISAEKYGRVCGIDDSQQLVEAIVIDNSSDQKTYLLLQEYGQELKRVALWYAFVPPHQSILSLGRNLGIERARAETVAFVDDDVILCEDWLEQCLKTFESDQTIAAVGGRIIEPVTEGLDSHEDKPIGKFYPDGRMTDNFYLDPSNIVEIDHIRGCNWSCKKSVLKTIGGFSPALQHVYEELDICMRLKNSRFRLVFNSKMSLFHRCGPRAHQLRQEQPELFFRRQRAARKFYTYILVKYFGLFATPTLRYIFTVNTGLSALWHQRSSKSFREALNIAIGKVSGILYCYLGSHYFLGSHYRSSFGTTTEFITINTPLRHG